jgi:hypothetical protein
MHRDQNQEATRQHRSADCRRKPLEINASIAVPRYWHRASNRRGDTRWQRISRKPGCKGSRSNEGGCVRPFFKIGALNRSAIPAGLISLGFLACARPFPSGFAILHAGVLRHADLCLAALKLRVEHAAFCAEAVLYVKRHCAQITPDDETFLLKRLEAVGKHAGEISPGSARRSSPNRIVSYWARVQTI